MEIGWVGKKVFLRTSDKVFQGKVINEDEKTITLIDVYNHTILISKDHIKLLKEEFEK